MKPFVSVIIPNYNHAKYLDERIGSVLHQTYQNFEVIILDDHSQDNSVEVIERYRGHPKVSCILLNKQNSGSTFIQWNKGIGVAKGELIWIAESDDSCAPDMLEELVDGYINHPSCSLLFTLSITINSQGEFTGKKHSTRKNKLLVGSDFIRRYMVAGNYVSNASSAIFSRKVALEIDKAYMKYSGGGDRLFWIEIAEKGNVYILKRQLNFFRRHEGVVTDKRSLDGTNRREAMWTYRYLIRGGYLKGLLRIAVLSYYRNATICMPCESKQVRQELYGLWGCNSFNKTPAVIFARLYTLWRKFYQ